MTENRRLLPGEDSPPEPALMSDQAARRPNGLDHMGFLLQVVQVVPMMMSLFGLFLTSVWALRVTTAATVVVAWGAIMLMSHDRGGRRDGPKGSGPSRRQEADRAVSADDAALPRESGEAVEK